MVGSKRSGGLGVLIAVAAALAAAASGGATATGTRAQHAKAGGIYRVAFEQSFGFTDGFDPTGEYYTYSLGILSNLMVRTLVGYDHVAGPPGNKLVPDLATSVPEPTDGGKTYTFHLKPGVKFGPPVNRAGHLEGRALRDRAHGTSEGRRRVRLLLLARSPASTRTPPARRRRSPASRRPTRARSSST